jgi:hypothetical protein
MWSSDIRHYVPKGATGAGVRLLIQFLMDEGEAARHARPHPSVRTARRMPRVARR